MNVMLVFNVIIGVFGFYMIISALKMKKSGEINSSVITKEEIASCRDREGFICFMYWREAVFGMVLVLWWILGMVDEFVASLEKFSLVQTLLFLAAFIWFQHGLLEARKKFIE